MACETKLRTLNYLKNKEILGKFNDVLNVAEFDKQNKQLTRYAELKYNLDFGGELLFSTYNVETVNARTSAYWRNDVSKRILAQPNDEMFRTIDDAKIRREIEGESDLPNPSFK